MNLDKLNIPVFGQKPDKVSYPKPEKLKVQETPKKRYPIAKVSAKRKAQEIIYKVERKKFLKDRVFCQVKRPECLGKASEVHHTFDGADRDKYFLDKTTWLGVCRNCHRWIHDFPLAATKLGFLK